MRKMQFHLSRGLDIPMAGPPRADVHAKPVASVALLPGDYPGIKPVLRVEEGERVSLGPPLFEDRIDPRLRFVAPGAGLVSAIHRGAKRVQRSKRLGLTEDQTTRMDSLRIEFSKETADLDAQIHKKQLDLATLIRDPQAKEETITAVREGPE